MLLKKNSETFSYNIDNIHDNYIGCECELKLDNIINDKIDALKNDFTYNIYTDFIIHDKNSIITELNLVIYYNKIDEDILKIIFTVFEGFNSYFFNVNDKFIVFYANTLELMQQMISILHKYNIKTDNDIEITETNEQ